MRNNPKLCEAIRLRLGFPQNLNAYLASVVSPTCTPEDAFNAHMAWVRSQGGTVNFEFKDLNDTSRYEHYAFQLRVVARSQS